VFSSIFSTAPAVRIVTVFDPGLTQTSASTRGAEQRVASLTSIVNKLKKSDVKRQALLRNAPMRTFFSKKVKIFKIFSENLLN
jgi:hypothetical protein